MSLEEKVAGDLREALRSRDQVRLSALRMLAAALHNARIGAGRDLADGEALAVVQREVKQRRDSIEQFRAGGRQDLVDKETAEIAVLEAYLPRQLGRDEIAQEARSIIANVGAAGPSDKGKVMGPLMERLRGRADGRLVNEVVTELLAGH
ncbi:MAG TPA: GatB/YqeY domain-containing protein [Dehalococcoidia bacterium]|nr:GatB/YqeY domain-containing protein [Dehalococcoidia bacterium]